MSPKCSATVAARSGEQLLAVVIRQAQHVRSPCPLFPMVKMSLGDCIGEQETSIARCVWSMRVKDAPPDSFHAHLTGVGHNCFQSVLRKNVCHRHCNSSGPNTSSGMRLPAWIIVRHSSRTSAGNQEQSSLSMESFLCSFFWYSSPSG